MPDEAYDSAGHVIIIQNPHDVLITNLITVYRHEQGLHGPGLQVAGTTHEHLRAEHIVDGIGHTDLCYSQQAAYHCEVWYAEHELRRGTVWPGRSGTSITVHLRPKDPEGPVLIQLSASIRQHPRERQTHGQVAHTHGPREVQADISSTQEHAYATELITRDSTLQLPTYIDMTERPTKESVRAELRKWGYSLLVWDCHPHNKFFCCKGDEQEPLELQHYLFCHTDVQDDQGCFVHSTQQRLTEERLMELLCSLGYARAVIIEQEVLHKQWTKILFSHQEPQLEQEHQQERERSPWPHRPPALRMHGEALIDLTQIENMQAQCKLSTNFDVADLQELFASGNHCLCQDFDLPGLPAFVKSEFQGHQPSDMELDQYDRLLIYTDGSSKPAGRRMAPLQADDYGLQDTWAFLVLGEQYETTAGGPSITPIGWTAQPVSYQQSGSAFTGTQRVGSDQAERAAITFAGLWRLSQNVCVHTVICTDSATMGGQAFGTLGVTDPDPSYMLMRGVFQALQQALTYDGLQLHHTRSHAGDPYNEFVDHAAKLEASRSFNHHRQQLDLQVWHKRLYNLWMVFGQRQGLPPWKNGGFDVPAPSLPPAQVDTEDSCPKAHIPAHDVSCAISLATANVQSLYKGPEGHGGKLHYLQAQMKFYKLNCLAIQEARTEAGVRVANNILCFASGHCNGQYGVEIWFDLEQPIGWQRKKYKYVEHKLSRNAFCVVHGDPRRLLVRCDHPLLDCWFFTAHGPHSGRPLQERANWWEETRNILQEYCDAAPMMWLVDANAAPGDADGHTVFKKGFVTSGNTPFFREALQERDLCLPATTQCHAGDNATWTTPDGSSQHCIDHIAVPLAWLSRCMHSQVLSDFDLAQRHDDHQVVTLQLQWEARIMQTQHHARKHKSNQIDYKDTNIKTNLRSYQPAPWHEDVEKQAGEFIHHLHQTMKQVQNTQSVIAKKPYVTPEVWQHRLMKLQYRQTNKKIRRSLAMEALHLTFKIWTQKVAHIHQEEIFNYGTSLRCSQVKSYMGFCKHRKLMRRRLQISKAAFLQQRLNQMNENSAAAEILKELKPFIGPTNPRKQKRATLPHVHNSEDKPCTLPTEALAVWVEFFREMEGGSRVTEANLRQQWIDCLRSFRQRSFELSMEEVPTLTELELAYRRVACKKATGPDGVPGELCRFHPELLAPATYTQMLKLVLHGQEPLMFKGGLLVPAYKGKGPTHRVNSFRSLLISSHLGKVIHRCIRQNKADAYEKYLQGQQLGGRRKVPVQLALHQARAFLRRARERHFSAGLLFLDLTEAFYRILREISMGGTPTDEVLCHVFHKLKLPADAMQQLHAVLDNGTALEHAGLSVTARNCFRAIHSNTHFWLAEQRDVVATALGTRPGDSFADVIFGFTWSMVLQKLQKLLIDQELIAQLPTMERPPFFAPNEEHKSMKPFVGPTWMDDLCLCVQHHTAQGLERAVGPAISYLLDLCEQHLMSPNLSKGKTELMLSFHGHGSRKMKVKHYGPQATGKFTVICERHTFSISLVKEYRHLGGVLHHTSDQQREVAQRLAIGHCAFNQHRRLLYHNEHIEAQKRYEIFNTLVLTKIMYGADSWIAGDLRTMRRFEAAILRLYRRLMKQKPDDHVSDQELLASISLPAPATILRRARLRYLLVLLRSAVPDLWHLLCEDKPWVQVMEDDMMWMWQQLRNASGLKDPSRHTAQWFELIQHHPSYWKKLVNRACNHEIMQTQKQHIVASSHHRMCRRLHDHCDAFLVDDTWEELDQCMEQKETFYGCMTCGVRCRTKAGEAAHMFKVHGHPSIIRCLFEGTSCGVCLKEFHTYGRMKAHLYYSTRCRRTLLSRGGQHGSQPGAGSMADRELERQHDRMLPPLQAEGPKLPEPEPRDFHGIDDQLYIFLVDFFVENQGRQADETILQAAIMTFMEQHAISWSCTLSTFAFFVNNLDENDATVLGFELRQVQKVFAKLSLPATWPIGSQSLPTTMSTSTIEHYHEALKKLHTTMAASPPIEAVPPVFGRHRIILHAFAGRRRLGDIQHYLERDMHEHMAYTITVVSLDIVINSTWGDASRASTRQMWLTAIRDRLVIAFLAGPPCETWSRVRNVNQATTEHPKGLSQEHLPRVLRDEASLWGYCSLALKELRQVNTGNCLLCFSLEALLETALAGSVGMLEHPAEPTDLEGAASIWKLPLIQVLLMLPGVERLRFSQGLLGSKTPKPTELMCVNLPDMMSFLHKFRVRRELPLSRAVGKDEAGAWRTTTLKEYAPAFCRAISSAIHSVFASCEATDESPDIPEAFADICRSMQVSSFGQTIGRDYAGV